MLLLKIAVIDGQGGGIGRRLIEKLKEKNIENIEIIALGTNSMATAAMLKAGADVGATGENAISVNANKVQVLMGPLAIVIPNSIMGEITPRISYSVGNSGALKILIPINRCNTIIAGTTDQKLNELLEKAVDELLQYHNTMKVR